MRTRNAILPAAAVFALAAATTEAGAASSRVLIGEAHRIMDIADDLASEFRTHYSHTDEYGHLCSDISKIRAEARHIDRLAHDCGSSLRHISADLEDLDGLAHHLHEVVDRLERHARHHRGHGHIHGDTGHVHRLLSALNHSIHSMQREVEHQMRAFDHGCREDFRRGGRLPSRYHHAAHDPGRLIGEIIWAFGR